MTDEQINDIANQQIVLAVKNFLVDERLLSIVKIAITKKPDYIIEVELASSDKGMLIYDSYILLYSVVFYLCMFATYFFIF